MRRPRWWTRTPVVLSVLLMAALTGGYVYRSGSRTLQNLEKVLQPELERRLGREVRMGRAYVSGASHVVIEDLAIPDGPTFASGTLLRARRSVLSFSLVGLLRHRDAPVAAISTLRVEDPDLVLVRQRSGEWNASTLLRRRTRRPVWKDFRGRLVLSNARITVRDHLSGIEPGPTVTRLQRLALTLDTRRAPDVQWSLSARGDGRVLGKLGLTGRYQLDRHELSLRASLDGASVRHWQRYFEAAPNLPARAGTASGSFEVAWTAGHKPRIEGTVRVPHLVLVPPAVQEPLVATPLVARIHNERVELEAQGHAAGMPISLAGEFVHRAHDAVLNLRLRAPRVTDAGGRRLMAQWPKFRGVTWQSEATLDARITGTSIHWQVGIDARLPRLRARGVDATDVRTRFTYQRVPRRFVIHSAEARAAGGKLAARGRIDVKQKPSRLSFTGTATDVDVSQLPFLGTTRKLGRATVAFTAQGTVNGVRTEAHVAGQEIVLGPARFGSLAADITVPRAGPTMVSARASGIAPYTVGDPPIRLASRGGRPSAGLLPVDGRGLPPVKSASARFEVLADRVRVRDGRLALAGQSVAVSGSATQAGALDLQVGTTGADAAALARLFGVDGVNGKADVRAHVGGTVSQPRVAGTLVASRGSVRDVAFGSIQAKYDLQGTQSGSVQFSLRDGRARGIAIRSASGTALLRGREVLLPQVHVEIPQGKLAAQGKVGRDGALDVALHASGVDLGSLAGLAGAGAAQGVPASGKATFEGRLGGTLSAPQVLGQVAASRGSLRGLSFDTLRAGIRADAGGLTLHDLSLRRGNESVALAGSASVRRGGALYVSGRLRADSLDMAQALRALKVSLPLAGRGKADLEISGTFPNLAVAGEFDVQEAALSGVALGRVSGRLRRSAEGGPAGIRVERLAIEDGPARLVATGSLEIGGRLALQVDGHQVPLAQLNRFAQPYVSLAGQVDVAGTVSGTTADPQLRLTVRGGPVSLNGHDLGTLSGELAYAGGEAQVANLSVARGQSTYRVQRLSIWPGKSLLDLDASAERADLAYLAAVARSLEFPDTSFGRDLSRQVAALPQPLQGTFTGKVALYGPVSHPSGSVEFDSSGLALGETRLRHFAGKASWAPGSVELRDGVIAADGVDVSGSVRYGKNRLTTQVRLGPSRVESLQALATSLASLIDHTSGQSEIRNPQFEMLTGAISGELALSGPVGALTGSARLALADARVGETRLAQTAATLRWDAGSVSADGLRLRAEGIDIGGSFAQRADGDLALDLQVADTDLGAVRDLTRAVASLGKASGRALLPDSAGDLLKDLPDPLAGRVTGTLVLSGRPGALSGRVDATGRDVRVGSGAYALVEAQGSWSPRGWSFPKLALSGDGCSLTGSAATGPNERLSARFTTENARLGALRDLLAALTPLRGIPAGEALLARLEGLPKPLDGLVTGSLALEGTLAEPETRVQLTGSGLVVGDVKLPRLSADADVRGSVVTIRDLSAAVNGGSLMARGTMDPHGALDLTVEGTDLALAAVRPLLRLKQKVAGHLDISARVSGTVDAPVGHARVVVREATLGGVRFSRIEADAVHLAEGRLNLGRVAIASDKVTGSVSGFVPFRWDPMGIPRDEPIHLTVSMPKYDLATLVALARPAVVDEALALAPGGVGDAPVMAAVRSASGQVGAELAVTGTLNNPNMDGKVGLHGVAIRPAMLDHGFRDINGDIRLQGPWVIVEGLRGRSDRGGWLTLSGRAAVRGSGEGSVDLRLRAEHVQLALQSIAGLQGLSYKGTANGELALTGRPGQSRLAGGITLTQSQLNVPNELTTQIPPMPKLPIDPVLDVNVRVGDGAWVKRGRSLSALVTGEADLRGMLSRPVVGGRAVVERGDLHYAGVNFRLASGGTVSFTYESPGQMATRLDLTALTRVRAVSPSSGERRNYDVTMHVTGAMPGVNVAVTSDPPDLPEHRLLAILARTDQFQALAHGEDMNSVLRDQVADILVGSVLPQVFEPIEAGIAQALGLDEVSFDYGLDRPLRVDARKELLPRLFISYNRDMPDGGQLLESRQQWTVSYRVLQRLYLGWRHEAQTGRSDRLVLEGSFRF